MTEDDAKTLAQSELASGKAQKGLMEECLSKAGGDAKAAGDLYAKTRASQLYEEWLNTTASQLAGVGAQKTKKPLSRFVAAGWAILGGSFGCHWFYLRKWLYSLPYIIASCAGFWIFNKAFSSLSLDELMNVLTTDKLPDKVTHSFDYNISLWLMILPAIAGVIEGILLLLTPKEKFDINYNSN